MGLFYNAPEPTRGRIAVRSSVRTCEASDSGVTDRSGRSDRSYLALPGGPRQAGWTDTPGRAGGSGEPGVAEVTRGSHEPREPGAARVAREAAIALDAVNAPLTRRARPALRTRRSGPARVTCHTAAAATSSSSPVNSALHPSGVGCGEGGNITSAGWQVILCDPIWHVSSRSGEASCELLYSVYLLPLQYTTIKLQPIQRSRTIC